MASPRLVAAGLRARTAFERWRREKTPLGYRVPGRKLARAVHPVGVLIGRAAAAASGVGSPSTGRPTNACGHGQRFERRGSQAGTHGWWLRPSGGRRRAENQPVGTFSRRLSLRSVVSSELAPLSKESRRQLSVLNRVNLYRGQNGRYVDLFCVNCICMNCICMICKRFQLVRPF
jgi:hypothetical protein